MKLFSLDYLICTVLLFLIMLSFPIIFSVEILRPMAESLTDFRISDIVDSKIVDRDNSLADTNMVLINTEYNKSIITNFELAKVVYIINQCEPKVVAIKEVLTRSGDDRYDRALAKVLADTKNLVLSERLINFNEDIEQFDSIRSSDDIFTKYASIGYENFLMNKDERFQTIRKFYPRAEINNNIQLSFAVKVAELYRPTAAKELYSRNNEHEIIHYLGHYHFFRMEMFDILDQNFEPDLFKDKIVILGRINTSDNIDSTMALNDVFFTPLNSRYTGKAFPDMHGTIIHANIISMMLNNTYFDSMPGWMVLLISIFLVYLNMVIFTYIVIKSKKWYEILSLAIFVFESVFILIITMVSFIYWHYEMNLTIPIFAIALSIIIYEIYYSSFKPLTIKTYYKFFHKR